MPPTAMETEATAPAETPPDDRFAWLEDQRRAIKDIQAGRASAESLDLEGIEDELDGLQNEIRDEFIDHVAGIVDQLVRMQTDVDDPSELHERRGDADVGRMDLAQLMKEHPSLEPEYRELFETGRAFGIGRATAHLNPLNEQTKGIRRACRYSFEQVVTFDPRPATPRPDGTIAGRGMVDYVKVDTDTWPPAVARKLNAGLKDLRRPFPILDDPGRMAGDAPGVRYERMAESGPPAKRPEAAERGSALPPPQPGIERGGLAAQAAPDRDR